MGSSFCSPTLKIFSKFELVKLEKKAPISSDLAMSLSSAVFSYSGDNC